VRGVKRTHRSILYAIENERVTGCGGLDLNSRSALILCKLLILQYAKLAKTAKKANPSYNFPTLSMKRHQADSRLLPLKPRHDSSAPSGGLSVSRFSVACNARINDHQRNPTLYIWMIPLEHWRVATIVSVRPRPRHLLGASMGLSYKRGCQGTFFPLGLEA
jgi:hypothetical protein